MSRKQVCTVLFTEYTSQIRRAAVDLRRGSLPLAACERLRSGNGVTVHAMLREGQIHTAHDAVEIMQQVIEQTGQIARRLWLCGAIYGGENS